ncbi:hypothetical protein [Thalassotalea maritima]
MRLPNIPNGAALEFQTEYVMTIQVVSFADDTDDKNIIPNVPG